MKIKYEEKRTWSYIDSEYKTVTITEGDKIRFAVTKDCDFCSNTWDRVHKIMGERGYLLGTVQKLSPKKIHIYLSEDDFIPGTYFHLGSKHLIYVEPDTDKVESGSDAHWEIRQRKLESDNPYIDSNYFTEVVCSHCGHRLYSATTSFGFPDVEVTDFCPGCGKRMVNIFRGK